MLKYTRAMILRTQMQIVQAVNVTRIVSLFAGVLIPLSQMMADSGLFLRNLILFAAALGFAVFSFFADTHKHHITKQDRKKAKKVYKATRFVANLYTLFLLGYGVFCANEAPTLLSILSLVPVACSILSYIIFLVIERIINAQLQLFVDAVEMDFKPFIESWKKVEKFVHTVANDGVEINTEIQVSEENRQILEDAVVVLEGETAKKKAKKKLEKKKKQEARTKLARAFVKGLFTYERRSVTADAPAIQEPEIAAPVEEPVAQIVASKKKNPLAFLTAKRKPAPEQIAEAAEENASQEALPKV